MSNGTVVVATVVCLSQAADPLPDRRRSPARLAANVAPAIGGLEDACTQQAAARLYILQMVRTCGEHTAWVCIRGRREVRKDDVDRSMAMEWKVLKRRNRLLFISSSRLSYTISFPPLALYPAITNPLPATPPLPPSSASTIFP